MKFRVFLADGTVIDTDDSIDTIRKTYRAGDIKKIKRIKK